ncbi:MULTISPECIES: hypothetical protein [unclassified Nocardiopsis]
MDHTDAETTIPTGEYSERQADLIAAALTGDTATIRRRLDEIANDDA